MTTKIDYTDEESESPLRAPIVAGMAISYRHNGADGDRGEQHRWTRAPALRHTAAGPRSAVAPGDRHAFREDRGAVLATTRLKCAVSA